MAQYIKINNDGSKLYYKDKQMKIRHREDGPAVEYANGNKAWWIDNTRHREDGPAYEGPDGYKEWFNNGELHREDGPAVEGFDGTKFWYLHGEEFTEAEFNVKMHPFDGKVIEIDGIKYKLVKI